MASIFSFEKLCTYPIPRGTIYLLDRPPEREPDDRLDDRLLLLVALDPLEREDERTDRLRLDPPELLPTDRGLDEPEDRTDFDGLAGREVATDRVRDGLDGRTERLLFRVLVVTRVWSSRCREAVLRARRA